MHDPHESLSVRGILAIKELNRQLSSEHCQISPEVPGSLRHSRHLSEMGCQKRISNPMDIFQSYQIISHIFFAKHLILIENNISGQGATT